MKPALILASESRVRAALLRNAGVEFEVNAKHIDESVIKGHMAGRRSPPQDIASFLAEEKAMRVATGDPDRLVLGCDQVLVHEGRLLDKPVGQQAARAQLDQLRGGVHDLLSAAVMVESGRPVWRHVGRATLTMREFSDRFLDRYMEEQGPEVFSCVGSYKLEAAGAQLFTRVEGDYFSVLGIPLLEVLEYLRARGVCET